jgi:hypothetical protein
MHKVAWLDMLEDKSKSAAESNRRKRGEVIFLAMWEREPKSKESLDLESWSKISLSNCA